MVNKLEKRLVFFFMIARFSPVINNSHALIKVTFPSAECWRLTEQGGRNIPGKISSLSFRIRG
jgi:hypothetical protein